MRLQCEMLIVDNRLEGVGVDSEEWYSGVIDLSKIEAIHVASMDENDTEYGMTKVYTSSGNYILKIPFDDFKTIHYND